MTSEVPIIRKESRLHEDNENEEHNEPSLEQQNDEDNSVDESDVTPTTEVCKLWTLDDIEGVVLEVLDDITIASAGEAMEKVASRRMFGFVAEWGSAILQETLISAIAPTGDTSIDSNDLNILNNSRVLLGRGDLALEILDPPKSCPDDSYQRSQIPIRAAKSNHYDGEDLNHADKSATRSHTYPASVASSRMTTKSKMRRKQHGGATTNVELTGPQPGIPYSTEVHTGKNRMTSPRKSIAIHHPAQVGTSNCQTEQCLPQSNNTNPGAGLQLSIDTESICQGNSGQSPSPLSKSPPSIVSARRRPHPPGSAQNGRAIKTFCFGEKEEEVKVEYAIQTAPPRKNNISTKSILPNIDSRKVLPSQSLQYPAFNSGGRNDGRENEMVGDDPLDQHFHEIPLSPGVKIRVGEESNDGPDLPLFASRMRRSTFVRMETCTLPTKTSDPEASTPKVQPNHVQGQQLGKGTFLTETAWDLSTADKSLTGDQLGRSHKIIDTDGWVKSDDVSSAEMTASCSCASSSSLTLFRKQGKVQRPCRSCNNKSSRTESTDFTNLVKQRAFHVKLTCLPTSSSPSKRAPGVSPRRVSSAPASSPLARRNLLFSKKAPRLHNRDLDSTTQIM